MLTEDNFKEVGDMMVKEALEGSDLKDVRFCAFIIVKSGEADEFFHGAVDAEERVMILWGSRPEDAYRFDTLRPAVNTLCQVLENDGSVIGVLCENDEQYCVHYGALTWQQAGAVH